MKDNRLTAKDWVDAGLADLARKGFTALKAETLAKRLGVSRGSFYWHFADVGAYHGAILQRWREIAMEEIIAGVERDTGDRMTALLHRVFMAESRLEMAVRTWAISEERAGRAVEAVDRERLAYVQGLLVAAGRDKRQAEARARILYWTYLGYALSGKKLEPGALQAVLEEMAGLALKKG
jgi:AcrR family transcriptional regulator